MTMRTLDTRHPTFDAQFAELVSIDTAVDREIERVAEAIVEDVRLRGDAALLEYTNRFDRMRASTVAELEIGSGEMRAALESIPMEQRAALETAALQVRRHAARLVEHLGPGVVGHLPVTDGLREVHAVRVVRFVVEHLVEDQSAVSHCDVPAIAQPHSAAPRRLLCRRAAG